MAGATEELRFKLYLTLITLDLNRYMRLVAPTVGRCRWTVCFIVKKEGMVYT